MARSRGAGQRTVNDGLSKGEIDRAGDVLRRRGAGEPVSDDDAGRAGDVLVLFRARWSSGMRPVDRVVSSLRSCSRRVEGARVSQRIKRTERIVDKLLRFPKMRLSRMQDIGGARCVVGSLTELRRVQDRLTARWAGQVVNTHDYVASPKPSGYRAVHIIVDVDGHLVEVQLRTARQHQWAMTVEQFEELRSEPLKAGVGDARILRELALGAEFLAAADAGLEPPADVLVEWRRLWKRR